MWFYIKFRWLDGQVSWLPNVSCEQVNVRIHDLKFNVDETRSTATDQLNQFHFALPLQRPSLASFEHWVRKLLRRPSCWWKNWLSRVGKQDSDCLATTLFTQFICWLGIVLMVQFSGNYLDGHRITVHGKGIVFGQSSHTTCIENTLS
jgi:hypothetical protein